MTVLIGLAMPCPAPYNSIPCFTLGSFCIALLYPFLPHPTLPCPVQYYLFYCTYSAYLCSAVPCSTPSSLPCHSLSYPTLPCPVQYYLFYCTYSAYLCSAVPCSTPSSLPCHSLSYPTMPCPTTILPVLLYLFCLPLLCSAL